MQKPNWKRALVRVASVMTLTGLPISTPVTLGQEASRAVSVPAGLQDPAAFQATPIQYLPFAHFAIPFDIDRSGRLPQEVHLWVSADQGRSWLKYASNSPDKRSFEFQAAAEGEYMFAVQTQDDRGISALAAAPPMRIMVDTTKPSLHLQADINAAGRLVIDYRIEDRFLSEESVRLSVAIDGRQNWEDIRVGRLTRQGDVWSGQIEQEMPRCREIELKLVAGDLAQNSAETTARYNAPRTASAPSGMQLASQRAQAKTPTLGEREPAQSNPGNAPNIASTINPTIPPTITPSIAPTITPSITPQLSGPRAAANRMSQLAGAESPVTAKAVQPDTNRLDSTAGGIAWEPTTASSRKPSIAESSRQQIGRTVSAREDDERSSLDLSTGFNTTQSTEDYNAAVARGSALSTDDQPIAIEELPRPSAIEDAVPVFTKSIDSQAKSSTVVTIPDALELSNAPSRTQTPSMPSSPALSSVLDRVQSSTPPAKPSIQSTPPTSAPVQSTIAPSVAADTAISLEPAPPSQFSPSAPSNASSAVPSTERTSDGETLPTIDKDAYHSRSRSFSLDYSVESLRGLPIADIELWGTDDRGNTWLKWGSDPDRESPFDVQVGTDGLYGFRMVIIGQNGIVSNRPNDGDPADMWINVDTKIPSVKITRALYGEGPDAGMLVIDYSCDDENLHDRPISLAYSERPSGPWTTIVTGLRNTGIYLWKADPNLPQQVYLRIQAVDRAGNVQEHRLDLPINLRGLTPRGRIQGFRPIDPK